MQSSDDPVMVLSFLSQTIMLQPQVEVLHRKLVLQAFKKVKKKIVCRTRSVQRYFSICDLSFPDDLVLVSIGVIRILSRPHERKEHPCYCGKASV